MDVSVFTCGIDAADDLERLFKQKDFTVDSTGASDASTAGNAIRKLAVSDGRHSVIVAIIRNESDAELKSYGQPTRIVVCGKNTSFAWLLGNTNRPLVRTINSMLIGSDRFAKWS